MWVAVGLGRGSGCGSPRAPPLAVLANDLPDEVVLFPAWQGRSVPDMRVAFRGEAQFSVSGARGRGYTFRMGMATPVDELPGGADAQRRTALVRLLLGACLTAATA